MDLGEYRSSADIDFLCSDNEGWRLLRETVSSSRLGQLFVEHPVLLREIRCDHYGIRTLVEVDQAPIKFEIISVADVQLRHARIDSLTVPVLARSDAIAQKFMALASRGADRAFLSRDLIDLSFALASWPPEDSRKGLAIAEKAFRSWVNHGIASSLQLFTEDASYRRKCFEVMDVDITDKRLLVGLNRLNGLCTNKDQFKDKLADLELPMN